MWNQGNHQFNMNQYNFMNNNLFHNNVNNGFQNGFNNMNNQMNNNMNQINKINNNLMNNNMNQMNNMNFNYNNKNFANKHNNFNSNNPLSNNYMMMQQQNKMIMQQNMQMQKMIQYNNQKLMMMKNMIYQQQMQQMQINHMQNLKNKMNQILNEGENGNNNNFYIQPEKIETEEERKEREEKEKISSALSDLAKEQIAQQQNFDQLQPPQNINYDEVDPLFMETFISDKELFSGNGHNLTGKWAHNENRGGRPYNPPDGWIGFGLNVINKYDNGNNDWLACDGRPGEWCVAYHGACVRNTSDQIKQIIKPILQNNLKPGSGQACAGNADVNHPGQTIGIGVYCTPNITTADGYAGIIEVN